MAILLTGFDPFGGHATNSSELVVNALEVDATDSLRTAVLRTEYQFAGDEIVRLIQEVEPTAVICLGMHEQGTLIRFERIARNWDSCSLPDNAGNLRLGQNIIDGAPSSYAASLPVDKLVRLLHERNVSAASSSDAGNYVCNHVFFRACHEVSQHGRMIPCGLIHIPPTSEFSDATDIGLPLPKMLDAIKVCIDELLPLDRSSGEVTS